MNPIKALIGLLVVLVGVALLGNNVGFWNVHIGQIIGQWWPLLLILTGLALILRHTLAILGIGIVVIAIIVIGAQTGAIRTETFNFSKQWNWSIGTETMKSFNETLSQQNADTFLFKGSGNMDVTIVSSDTDSVTADLTGPESVIKSLTLSRTNKTIQLTADPRPAPILVFPGSFQAVTGTITIPKSLNLNTQTSGAVKTTVRDFNGAATLYNSGASTTTFQLSNVINPTLGISGASQVTFDTCTGMAIWEISGASRVTAEDCNLTNARIDVSGSSNASIDSGTVQNADLKVSGASHVKMPAPKGTVKQDSSGASSIRFED
jgi:hypothetical protein